MLFVLSLVLLAGCGGNDDEVAPPAPASIMPSAELAPRLESSRAFLAGPDRGDPAVLADLERYNELRQAFYDGKRRAAAAEELVALLSRQPTHVLWSDLEYSERRFLGDDARTRAAAILSQPICTDTSTAFGAYVHAWRIFKSGDYLEQFHRARAINRVTHELDPFASLWIDLKAVAGERRRGDPAVARALAFESLSRAREIGGRRLEAKVWKQIARLDRATGELDDALLAASMADTLATMAIEAIGEGAAIVDLLEIRLVRAGVLAARRDVEAALALYDANIARATELDLSYVASRNLNRAAMLSEAVGLRDLGLRYCRRGLDVALDDGDSLNVPRHMMNIARRLRMRGELDSCLVYRERATRWVEAYGAPANVSRLPLMLAEYHAQVGEYAVVDSLLNAAAGHSFNLSSAAARAELHLELIRGWMEADRPDLVYRSMAAIEDLRYGSGDVAADRHVTADLNLMIGEFLTRRGEWALAASALDSAATALQRRVSPSRSWKLARNRGQLARERGDLIAAEAAFRRCIDLGIELGSPEYVSTGRFLLGSVLLAAGRHAEARAAFPSTDPADFVGRFTTRVSALVLTGISHAAEGDYDDALEVFDRARDACRSWSPTDLLGRIDLETGRAHAGAGRFETAAAYYDEVAARLIDTDYFIASDELAWFNGDLRRDLVEAVVMLPEAEAAGTLGLARRVLPRWRASAGAGALIPSQVIFFVGETISGRWDVAGTAARWTPLPGAAELKALLAPVLADMSEPGRAVNEDDVRRLSTTLLAGVTDFRRPGQDLTIVPDGALFGLPWAALQVPGTKGMLIEHGPLVVADMPASVRADRRHAPTGRLLVAGKDRDAGAREAGLEDLHHAEREAREVAAVWPPARVDLKLGADAARALTASADLADFEAIHVASHALVFDGRSEGSMLLLAGAAGDAMTASSIRDLDLAAEVVFLSCCEAVDGRDRRAGNAGLARSFLDAGARSVVAPLTVIDDEAARRLATGFYGHWLEGKTVAEALRAAQRDLRDADARWAHPFYWAFYQVIAADSE